MYLGRYPKYSATFWCPETISCDLRRIIYQSHTQTKVCAIYSVWLLGLVWSKIFFLLPCLLWCHWVPTVRIISMSLNYFSGAWMPHLHTTSLLLHQYQFPPMQLCWKSPTCLCGMTGGRIFWRNLLKLLANITGSHSRILRIHLIYITRRNRFTINQPRFTSF